MILCALVIDCRVSLKRFDVFSTAMGCILVAGKVEEHSRPLRDVSLNTSDMYVVQQQTDPSFQILFMFHHMYQRRKRLVLSSLDISSPRYTEWKAELAAVELHLLNQLGFSLYAMMDHPHKYILYYLRILDGAKDLSQLAWNYLNDSMRLDVSLRYTAQELACAAIYMSARCLQHPLPGNPPWWKLMTDDIDKIYEISERILSLYGLSKVNIVLFWFYFIRFCIGKLVRTAVE
jgi:hypothetical protein